MKITIEKKEPMNYEQGDIYYAYIDDKIVFSKEYKNNKDEVKIIKSILNKILK